MSAANQRTAASRSQDEQEPAEDRERQADPSDGRNDQGVEDADDRDDAECARARRRHGGPAGRPPRPGAPRRRESSRPARCATRAAAAWTTQAGLSPPRALRRAGGGAAHRRRAYSVRSRRSASAFRCWSSLWSALSSVFWRRPVEEAGDESVVRLLGLDQRPAVPRLERVDVDRLDAERRAGPGDPARASRRPRSWT